MIVQSRFKNIKTGKITVVEEDDGRTPKQILEEQRSVAVLSRIEFCKALKKLSVLPADEAVRAARGEWPATFADYTSSLPADEATDLEILWAGVSEIHYSDPYLQALALHKAGDQPGAVALLDQIFGITS